MRSNSLHNEHNVYFVANKMSGGRQESNEANTLPIERRKELPQRRRTNTVTVLKRLPSNALLTHRTKTLSTHHQKPQFGCGFFARHSIAPKAREGNAPPSAQNNLLKSRLNSRRIHTPWLSDQQIAFRQMKFCAKTVLKFCK